MPFLSFDRLDRYAVRLFVVPLLTALATMLLATMLQRLLRLFDIAASTGASITSALVAAADLVPHYLGLALPVAFTAAIFMAAARMGDDSELDAMLATGRSITRIAVPYFILALLLSMFNLYLFGQLQPLARYDYHVKMDAVLQTNWNAKIEENRFIDIAHGFSFSADSVEDGGRRFQGVFMERRQNGVEEITTAVRGKLETESATRKLRLKLEDGLRVRQTADGAISTARFADGFVEDFSPVRAPFRDRGESATERTLPELWLTMYSNPDPDSSAEFHSRLARALLPPLLPLLALPLGMASKRGRRTPGVVFASLALLLLNHTLQFGKSMAESGRLPAALAVWTPYVLFALLSLWIFRGSLAWPGDNPVSRTIGVLERLIERLKPRRSAKVAA
ncbi:LptF/LptG family permease [Ramlibacter sp. H39-3-26]|uniref:LptF/LptG family permease n=1 Tax=Curvibacter soli TaxID=3031331 RepID=UPI0023DB8127|nr:LptF/LptG family permease [Ramlibacter sp. H39-3-26]MDF1483846.1 LptF/LptG family permease [Ramlibacter sp. H39-3-26]